MGVRAARSTRNSPAAAGRRRAHKQESGILSTLELRTLAGFRTIFGSARRFDKMLRRSTGIPGSLLWALSEIEHTGGMSVNELAARLALHQTTASNIINALVERKLVRRGRQDADQRVVHLHISAQGKQVLRRAPGPHAGLLVDALRRLETDQLQDLQNSLAVVVAVMRRTTATAAGETLLGE